jgi:hypothetical protein
MHDHEYRAPMKERIDSGKPDRSYFTLCRNEGEGGRSNRAPSRPDRLSIEFDFWRLPDAGWWLPAQDAKGEHIL